jgi:peptide/nickel transport system ATP-binding protein
VIAQMAEQVVVMYAGDRRAGRDRRDSAPPAASLYPGADRLAPGAGRAAPTPVLIPGQVPDLAALPAGCAFAERCERATARCRQSIPPLSGKTGRPPAFTVNFRSP